MSIHWDVWAPHLTSASRAPAWRAQLCDGGRHYGELFTLYDLNALADLVKGHDRLYPVYLCCYWSDRVERAARAALERSGLQLAESCIPF